MASKVFRLKCEERLRQGDTFRFRAGDEWEQIEVPHNIPAGSVFEVSTAQLPFSFRRYGCSDPPVQLPAARAVRCVFCDAVVRQSAAQPVCPSCLKKQFKDPPGKVVALSLGGGARPERTDGDPAAWRECPGCKKAVAQFGFGWAHHLQHCSAARRHGAAAAAAAADGGGGGGGAGAGVGAAA
eukprot:SAG22_NODE_2697_length_2304_cov_5.536054_1_plen_182_part_10